ncbi:hypothetical protein NE865_01705 [Phthorimaea operculella]|nr:hypothetical protein NE865_01705 [Phthorimaea operculella]
MSERSQKCCFCLPLRGGLLFLAYLNVFVAAYNLAIGEIGLLTVPYWALINAVALDLRLESLELYYYLPYLLDLAYGAALLYALYKNDTTVLNVYVWYSITYTATVFYVGVVLLWRARIGDELMIISVVVIIITVLYQGWIAFLVYKMRIEINRNTVVSTNENKMSNCPEQLTNDSDVESQPLPSAPAPAHAAGTSL